MNDIELGLKIAEVYGWKFVSDDPKYKPYFIRDGRMVNVESFEVCAKRDIDDLASMRLVFVSCTEQKRKEIGECLVEIVKPKTMSHGDVASAVIGATARQLAEAIVMAMEE